MLDAAMEDIPIITGQKPKVNRARKSIASFRLRQGSADRLQGHASRRSHVGVHGPGADRGAARVSATSAGLPATSFDGRGNYTLGVDEQLIFPEIDYDKRDRRSAAWTSRS